MQLTFVYAEIASILMATEGFENMEQSSAPGDTHNSPVVMTSSVWFTTHNSASTLLAEKVSGECMNLITNITAARSRCMLAFSTVLHKHLQKQMDIHFTKANRTPLGCYYEPFVPLELLFCNAL